MDAFLTEGELYCPQHDTKDDIKEPKGRQPSTPGKYELLQTPFVNYIRSDLLLTSAVA